MSGRLPRLACTVATAAALACGSLLAPGTAVAVAEQPPAPGTRTAAVPEEPSAPGTRTAAAPEQPPAPGTRTAAVAEQPPAPGTRTAAAPEQPPAPGTRTVAELLTDLRRLCREAERAAEAYHATEEELTRRRAETGRLDAALAKARLTLHESRGAAGRLARQQYQGSTDISPYVRLLLARDPQQALDQGHVIGQLARERVETVGRLAGRERRADELARAARTALDRQLTLAERTGKQRDDVRRRLDDVEELLASLTAAQLAAITELAGGTIRISPIASHPALGAVRPENTGASGRRQAPVTEVR